MPVVHFAKGQELVAEHRAIDDDMYDDQIAAEDQSTHTVMVPPGFPNDVIPVPISLDAKPGSLVLPTRPRRPGFDIPLQHRRQIPRGQLPRGPPLPVHKQPHVVKAQYIGAPQSIRRFPPHPSPYPQPPPPGPGVFFPQHPGNVHRLPVSIRAHPQNGFAQNLQGHTQNVQPPQNNFRPPTVQQTNQVDIKQEAHQPHSGDHNDLTEFRNPKDGDVHNKREISPANEYNAPLPQVDVRAKSIEDSSQGRSPVVNSIQHSADSNAVASTDVGFNEQWPPVASADMPKIIGLDVKCEKNLMRVRIEFDSPFYGIIFSKGHYSNVHCVHMPAGLGKTHSTFDISINSCGTKGNTENGLYGHGLQSGSGTFFENIIVVQYDPQVQEVWDQARKLRCTWHDQYEKSVTFKPFSVDTLNVVRADFAGDNVGCWMQIQVGKGPWASEVSGLVKIGQTMTMVLAIKDEDSKFDMLVRNCIAHDGERAPIQLVDQRGCITRPKLMSRFTKIKDFGASASVLSYAHFQAFKFPDSMEVHFQCTIQICRYQCPDPCTEGSGYSAGSVRDHRKKRELDGGITDITKEIQGDIGVNKVIRVISKRDLSIFLEKDNTTEEITEVTDKTVVSSRIEDIEGLICMSSPGFAATLVVLLGILIISCLLSAYLCIRFRHKPNDKTHMLSNDFFRETRFF